MPEHLGRCGCCVSLKSVPMDITITKRNAKRARRKNSSGYTSKSERTIMSIAEQSATGWCGIFWRRKDITWVERRYANTWMCNWGWSRWQEDVSRHGVNRGKSIRNLKICCAEHLRYQKGIRSGAQISHICIWQMAAFDITVRSWIYMIVVW